MATQFGTTKCDRLFFSDQELPDVSSSPSPAPTRVLVPMFRPRLSPGVLFRRPHAQIPRLQDRRSARLPSLPVLFPLGNNDLPARAFFFVTKHLAVGYLPRKKKLEKKRCRATVVLISTGEHTQHERERERRLWRSLAGFSSFAREKRS